jgi:hypothetical protein
MTVKDVRLYVKSQRLRAGKHGKPLKVAEAPVGLEGIEEGMKIVTVIRVAHPSGYLTQLRNGLPTGFYAGSGGEYPAKKY